MVTISTSKGSDEDKIVLNVEVTERLTGTFQVGAGFSTIENFVLQAQIQYDNFLGRGTTVTLVAQMSSLRRLFNLAYITRYFFDTRWNFSFNIFNSRNVFPGFSREAAEFLVKERRIDAIGVDTASIDYGRSQDFMVHQIINGANKPAFENLANVDRLPAAGATLVALPMKITGGSGGPVRAIAILP